MKTPKRIVTLLPIVLLAGCASAPSTEREAALVDEARRTAGALIQTLSAELQAAMQAGGPGEAIGVCKERAPAIAADASRGSGMQVRRVSPRQRNPEGASDAWELAAQAALEKRLAAGEKPETLDTYAVVDTWRGAEFRYARALITQPMCVTCHGAVESLPEVVKARLAVEYPGDQAVGYTPGTVRGVLSIRTPL